MHTTPIVREVEPEMITEFHDVKAGDRIFIVQDEWGREVAVFVKHDDGTVEQIEGEA